jgi:hypothetical protein
MSVEVSSQTATVNGHVDPEKAAAELINGVENVKLDEKATDANSDVFVDAQAVNGTALAANNHIATTAKPEARSETPSALAAFESKLPLSSVDGVLKLPFRAPLDVSKSTVRPALTTEQETKYNTVLNAVSQWTEIPETTARNSSTTPITDNERMFMTREGILRYLRASSWNVAQAETRLKNTLIWRREYGVEKHTKDYISVEQETGKQLLLGWDNEGRTCEYMRPSRQNTERSDRQIEHLVFILERAVELLPPGQENLCLLINFAETKSGQGATIGQGKQTLNILQNHYPERMGRALVTNVPWYIWTFFKLITPFIDPVTREKIKFNEDSGLHVPRVQLLKESGGLVEFEYDHDTYWPALNELCELRRAEYQARWEKGGKRVGEYEGYLKGADEKSLAEREAETKQPTA